MDPFRQLLYSTRAQDVSAISAYQKSGLSLTAALNAVLADRKKENQRDAPGGLPDTGEDSPEDLDGMTDQESGNRGRV